MNASSENNVSRAPGASGQKDAAGARDAVTDVLLAVYADANTKKQVPALGNVLRLSTELHGKLIWCIENQAKAQVSPCVTGMEPDGSAVLKNSHSHLHILPIADENFQASHPAESPIRRFLFHAEAGLDDATLAVLRRRPMFRIYLQNKIYFIVTPEKYGKTADFRELALLQTSSSWTSVTPFVPPRFLKATGVNSLAGQIRSELASRKLPEPSSIEIDAEDGWHRIDTEEGAALFWSVWRKFRPDIHPRAKDRLKAEFPQPKENLSSRWRGFVLERKDARKPKVPCSFGIRLCFAEGIAGPLSLGYGAHFGMGLFGPARPT